MGEKGVGLTPMMHAGEGLCPPEDYGGIPGFLGLLSGESEFIEEYPAEFLKKLREREFHPPRREIPQPRRCARAVVTSLAD